MNGDHIYTCDCDPLTLAHGRPQTFSKGGQNFQGGGKNILFFWKVEKHTILAGQGGGGKRPLLPSPVDAHDLACYIDFVPQINCT